MSAVIELRDHTKDPEYLIGLEAAECYDSNRDRDACIRRAKHCKDSGHLATLRFAYATIRVSNISRVCSHQIVRMAHAGILQRSQRYVAETSVDYITPPALEGRPQNFKDEWRILQDDAEALYLHAIKHKLMKKEDARYILPQGCTTALSLCLNFQGWRDFLKNRNAKHAQWEVRDVAEQIQAVLAGIAPNIFGGTNAAVA